MPIHAIYKTKDIFSKLGNESISLENLAVRVQADRSTVKRHIAWMRKRLGLTIVSNYEGHTIVRNANWQKCRDFFELLQ